MQEVDKKKLIISYLRLLKNEIKLTRADHVSYLGIKGN